MPTCKPSICVVDDDASVRTALRRLIRAFGFCSATFASGGEFLETVAARIPACLILDVRLPGWHGLDLQDHLSAAGYQIPIIFITAHEDPQAHERAMRAGAVAFLSKPFSDQSLLEAINTALQKGRSA